MPLAPPPQRDGAAAALRPLTVATATTPPLHQNHAAAAARRHAQVEDQIARLKRVAPQVEVMHEIGATEPEECLLAMGVDLPMLPCTFHVLVQVNYR